MYSILTDLKYIKMDEERMEKLKWRAGTPDIDSDEIPELPHQTEWQQYLRYIEEAKTRGEIAMDLRDWQEARKGGDDE